MAPGLKKRKHVDRNDKWYVLAKEQGYRSRAAFKLAHINKEFDIIGAKTRVVLDLCAAPGGWAQVAAKAAGRGAAVIAVDLLPIRPIPNVRTIVGDITMDTTHQHNEIALLALKCGVECGLRRGGSFVTKVYRGQDYNALTWAFGRLFERVRATKPASSRAQSAEIFVVCSGYLAPQKVDPKLLDPKHVFGELGGGLDDAKPLGVLHPQAGKKKRQRQGYADNDSGLLVMPTMTALQFLRHADPAQILAERSAIVFDGAPDAVCQHKATTAEVRACGEDLKVLSKGDFRVLLKWREKLRKADAARSATTSVEDDDDDAEAEDVDSDDEVMAQIAAAKKAVAADARREKKRVAKAAAKARARRGAGIVEQSSVELGRDEDIFSFAAAQKAGGVDALEDQQPEDEEGEEDGADRARGGPRRGQKLAEKYEAYGDDAERGAAIEDQLDASYEAFADRRAQKSGAPRVEKQRRAKKYRDAVAAELVSEDMALAEGDVDDYAAHLGRDGDSASSGDDSSDDDLDPAAQRSASRWFSNPLFDDDGAGDGGDAVPADAAGRAAALKALAATAMPKSDKELRREKRKKASERQERRDKRKKLDEGGEDDALHRAAREAKEAAATALIKAGVGAAKHDGAEGFSVAPMTAALERERNPFEQAEQTYLSDSEDDDDKAETLALATMMLRKSKAKELVDASYNRYAWNDPKDLPSWFLDDEKRHYRPQLPIKPALLAEMKQRFQNLAAKPIAKVAEARARKKTRADARLKAAKRKAEAVANDPDMSAGRKLKEVEKAMARGTARDARPDKIYVVASKSKSGVKKKTSAPKGAAKGSRVVTVDKRMKADKRAIKAQDKRKKKFGSGKRGRK
ncbi:RNA methyltransferase [Aureococcus anophagefferens]|nr:RNA methyltransferase [Aureococcus anophagefferens]